MEYWIHINFSSYQFVEANKYCYDLEALLYDYVEILIGFVFNLVIYSVFLRPSPYNINTNWIQLESITILVEHNRFKFPSYH